MTKERLRDYRAIAQEKKALEHQIETDDLVAGHQALLELYRDKLDRMAEELIAIEQAIDRLPVRERAILRRYYLQGMTWEEVCVAEHYSWRQVHRAHSAALQKLEEAEKEIGEK